MLIHGKSLIIENNQLSYCRHYQRSVMFTRGSSQSQLWFSAL